MDVLQLIEQVTAPELWPGFKDDNRLQELDDLASEAFDRKTLDGYLAYVLITHQLCDELLRVLIAHTRFALRLMVASNGFDIKFSTKDHDADLERLMTGQLISALELSLEFDEKEEFLKLCREMGEIRNRLTHELARKVDLGKLEATTDKYRAKNKRAEELFFEADDTFRLLYKDYKKDDSWDWTLQEMIEDDGLDGDMKAQCKRIIKLRKAAGYSLNFESSLR